MANCLVISELAPARREMIAAFSRANPASTFLQSSSYTVENQLFTEHEIQFALIAAEQFDQELLQQIVQLRLSYRDVAIVLFLHTLPDANIKRIINDHDIKVQSYQHLNECLSQAILQPVSTNLYNATSAI